MLTEVTSIVHRIANPTPEHERTLLSLGIEPIPFVWPRITNAALETWWDGNTKSFRPQVLETVLEAHYPLARPGEFVGDPRRFGSAFAAERTGPGPLWSPMYMGLACLNMEDYRNWRDLPITHPWVASILGSLKVAQEYMPLASWGSWGATHFAKDPGAVEHLLVRSTGHHIGWYMGDKFQDETHFRQVSGERLRLARQYAGHIGIWLSPIWYTQSLRVHDKRKRGPIAWATRDQLDWAVKLVENELRHGTAQDVSIVLYSNAGHWNTLEEGLFAQGKLSQAEVEDRELAYVHHFASRFGWRRAA